MSFLLDSPTILFGQHPLSHLGRNFRQGPTYSETEIAAFVVIGVSVIAAVVIGAQFFNSARHYSNPRGLFGELCKAHALSRKEIKLLRRIAKTQQVKHTATLFLDPDRFSEDDGGGELSLLREKIFGSALTAV